MTSEERALWIREWALADLAAVLTEPAPAPPSRPSSGATGEMADWWRHGRQLDEWRERRQRAGAGIVPLRLAGWLGRRPTPTEAVQFHRAYLWGERAGWWRRLKTEGRTWALELVERSPAEGDGEATDEPQAEGGQDDQGQDPGDPGDDER